MEKEEITLIKNKINKIIKQDVFTLPPEAETEGKTMDIQKTHK